MARSIHTTKKQLIRERWFTHADGVSQAQDATELERKDFQKTLHKVNEARKRQAIKQDAPAHAYLSLRGSELARTVKKSRTKTNETGNA
jgi:hypothetical protein